jgi:hypothetical protein
VVARHHSKATASISKQWRSPRWHQRTVKSGITAADGGSRGARPWRAKAARANGKAGSGGKTSAGARQAIDNAARCIDKDGTWAGSGMAARRQSAKGMAAAAGVSAWHEK